MVWSVARGVLLASIPAHAPRICRVRTSAAHLPCSARHVAPYIAVSAPPIVIYLPLPISRPPSTFLLLFLGPRTPQTAHHRTPRVSRYTSPACYPSRSCRMQHPHGLADSRHSTSIRSLGVHFMLRARLEAQGRRAEHGGVASRSSSCQPEPLIHPCRHLPGVHDRA